MNEPYSTDRQQSVALSNQGIEAKRNGDYTLALQYYDRARQADPANPQVYYNIGKLSFGLGNYDQAFRNLLTYANLGLAVGLFGEQMLALVGQIYVCDREITPGVFVRPDVVNVVCHQNSSAFTFASDPNLARYSGLCYLGEDSSLLAHHQLDSSSLERVRAHVLNPHASAPQPSEAATGSILTIGFLYLTKNLYFQPEPGRFDRYLSNQFVIDRDITEWDVP